MYFINICLIFVKQILLYCICKRVTCKINYDNDTRKNVSSLICPCESLEPKLAVFSKFSFIDLNELIR